MFLCIHVKCNMKAINTYLEKSFYLNIGRKTKQRKERSKSMNEKQRIIIRPDKQYHFYFNINSISIHIRSKPSMQTIKSKFTEKVFD